MSEKKLTIDANLIQMLVTVIGLVIQFGVPAIQDAIAKLGLTEISAEDIASLETLIKPPDQY